MIKKLFILGIKYIPVITMTGILINNTLCYNDIYIFSNLIDFITSSSLLSNSIFFIASFIFNFCAWHKLIIISNTIIITIIFIDREKQILLDDLKLLVLYYIITGTAILLSTIIHVYNKKKQ